MKWAICLHGGAGDIAKDMPLHKREQVEAALSECLELGVYALEASRSALDVVELVVRALEDNPLFNAGRGSVLTADGTVEMEASIMDGQSRSCGAASGLTTVVNPISLARLVMEKTPHVYLAFEGAERFAKQQGVPRAEPEYFMTKKSIKQLQLLRSRQPHLIGSPTLETSADINFNGTPDTSNGYLNGTLDMSNGKSNGTLHVCNGKVNGMQDMSNGHGSANGYVNGSLGASNGIPFIGETVGCVVVDKFGNCAAATSTGGRTNKMVGRIGDTPLTGAGNYANHLCAISATGIGENIVRSMVCVSVAAIMEFKGASLADAVREVIEERVEEGTTGVIAVSSTGELSMAFNTTGMFRAAADESGHHEVGIWN